MWILKIISSELCLQRLVVNSRVVCQLDCDVSGIQVKICLKGQKIDPLATMNINCRFHGNSIFHFQDTLYSSHTVLIKNFWLECDYEGLSSGEHGYPYHIPFHHIHDTLQQSVYAAFCGFRRPQGLKVQCPPLPPRDNAAKAGAWGESMGRRIGEGVCVLLRILLWSLTNHILRAFNIVGEKISNPGMLSINHCTRTHTHTRVCAHA